VTPKISGETSMLKGRARGTPPYIRTFRSSWGKTKKSMGINARGRAVELSSLLPEKNLSQRRKDISKRMTRTLSCLRGLQDQGLCNPGRKGKWPRKRVYLLYVPCGGAYCAGTARLCANVEERLAGFKEGTQARDASGNRSTKGKGGGGV